MAYQTYFQRVATISPIKQQQMANLYFEYYAGSDKAKFYQDLAAKDEVLFLEFDQQIVGFTTLQVYPFLQHIIIYSGDTIVAPAHRQQQSIPTAWISRMGLLKQTYPTQELYWFLLVKGYKTYKYLVVFTQTFYPDWRNQQPQLKALADQLALAKFGDLYNIQTGIVECPSNYGYLKKPLTKLTPYEQQKVSAQFFIHKNPYYYQGHELVCLCEISETNIHHRLKPLFLNPQVNYRDD